MSAVYGAGAASSTFGPYAAPCAECDAQAGEPCAPWCIGAALFVDELEARRPLVRRGVLLLAFAAAAALGACAPLWDAMPWAVTP